MSFSNVPSRLPSSLLSLASVSALLSIAIGCGGSDEGRSSADMVGKSSTALTEVTGQVDPKAFPLDNPAVVAQCADGKTVLAPLAANGSFKLGLQADASYRLLLANAIGSASYYAISHVQWHAEAGFSEWAQIRGGAPIPLGTIKPMSEIEAASCAACKAGAQATARGGARTGIWGEASGGAAGYVGGAASAQYSAKYDAHASFGGKAGGEAGGGGLLGSVFGRFFGDANVDVGVSVSVNASASASIQGQWGWVGGGAWSGMWGGSDTLAGAGSASGSFAAGASVCDELRMTQRVNFSSTDNVGSGVHASAASSGEADAEAKLGAACSGSAFQQPPPATSQPVAIGGSCGFNAQCGSGGFCASNVCVSTDSSLK